MGGTDKRLKIVMLTTRLVEDIWLVNKVADVCNIVGIVFPSGERYREYGVVHVLKNRIRRIGPLALADQALLILYRLAFESRRDKKAAKDLFPSKPTDYIERKGIDILEVEDINTSEVNDFIMSKSPELVVVSGAPLLKQTIINAVQGRIINMHPGIAPEYRGRYGCFWPIYNQEPKMVGATVHFVDKGIDTGAILLQRQVDYYTDDSLKIITYKQHKIGGDLLVKCLQQYESLAANAHYKADCPSRNYTAPGLSHYLKGKRWLKRKYGAKKLISSS